MLPEENVVHNFALLVRHFLRHLCDIFFTTFTCYLLFVIALGSTFQERDYFSEVPFISFQKNVARH